MMNDLNYPELQERIQQELNREKQRMQLFLFLLSLGFYIVLMIVGWGLFLNNGGQPPSANIPGMARDANPLGDAMMMVSIAGFVPLLIQLVNLIVTTRVGEKQLRERIAGRIMQAELKKRYDALEAEQDKPKHAMSLTDDGELEEIAEEEQRSVSNSQRK